MEIPKLYELVIRQISHNMDKLPSLTENSRSSLVLDTIMGVDILSKSKRKITAESMKVLQEICPGLEEYKDADGNSPIDMYWKDAVCSEFRKREIYGPYDVVAASIIESRERLISDTLAEEEVFQELLNLEQYPFSIELFHNTKIGLAVNSIKKSLSTKNSEKAKSLLDKWKQVHKVWNEIPPSQEVILGRLSLTIKSWQELYEYCQQEEDGKLKSAALKLKSATASEKAGRRSVLPSTNVAMSCKDRIRIENASRTSQQSIRSKYANVCRNSSYSSCRPSSSPAQLSNALHATATSKPYSVAPTNKSHEAPTSSGIDGKRRPTSGSHPAFKGKGPTPSPLLLNRGGVQQSTFKKQKLG